nr:hypothetical protein GCM10020093_000660 [Planobispora longispora]
MEAAEVIIVDASGSMSGDKIAEACRAAQAAVDTLRDGVHFAIVAGTHEAIKIFPETRGTVRADPHTRRQAGSALSRLAAGGGTAIGKWLRLAAELLADHPGAVRHAILLTDGQNNEDERTFGAALAHCAGRFVCDSRGSAPTGPRPSCARSPTRCWAPPGSSAGRRSSPTTSGRWSRPPWARPWPRSRCGSGPRRTAGCATSSRCRRPWRT